MQQDLLLIVSRLSVLLAWRDSMITTQTHRRSALCAVLEHIQKQVQHSVICVVQDVSHKRKEQVLLLRASSVTLERTLLRALLSVLHVTLAQPTTTQMLVHRA